MAMVIELTAQTGTSIDEKCVSVTRVKRRRDEARREERMRINRKR